MCIRHHGKELDRPLHEAGPVRCLHDLAAKVHSTAKGRYCTWAGCSHNPEGSSYFGKNQGVGNEKVGLLSSSSSFELRNGSASILGHHISGRPSGCFSLSLRFVTTGVHHHPFMRSAGMSGAAWQYLLLRPPHHPLSMKGVVSPCRGWVIRLLL